MRSNNTNCIQNGIAAVGGFDMELKDKLKKAL